MQRFVIVQTLAKSDLWQIAEFAPMKMFLYVIQMYGNYKNNRQVRTRDSTTLIYMMMKKIAAMYIYI
jgi:hypothetical protein